MCGSRISATTFRNRKSTALDIWWLRVNFSFGQNAGHQSATKSVTRYLCNWKVTFILSTKGWANYRYEREAISGGPEERICGETIWLSFPAQRRKVAILRLIDYSHMAACNFPADRHSQLESIENDNSCVSEVISNAFQLSDIHAIPLGIH